MSIKMKTKGIRLTKDVLDAALAGGTILGGGGGRFSFLEFFS